MIVARSPGGARWAKKATVAAPQRTTRADPMARAMRRSGARARRGRRAVGPGASPVVESRGLLTAASVDSGTLLLDEVRVIERRSSLCVLLPHVLQAGGDRE